MSLNTVPTNYHEFEYSKFSVFKLKFMTTGRIHASRWVLHSAPSRESPGQLTITLTLTHRGGAAVSALPRLGLDAITWAWMHARASRSRLAGVVLEAELVNVAIPLDSVGLLHALAPFAFRKAGKGGLVLAPLDQELQEVTGAVFPHPSRCVRLDYREQPRVKGRG